jgi:hypothetical protein
MMIPGAALTDSRIELLTTRRGKLKIYEVCYLDVSGNVHEWLTSRAAADKRNRELERNKKDEGIETVFPVAEHSCDISGSGFISFLNQHCRGEGI